MVSTLRWLLSWVALIAIAALLLPSDARASGTVAASGETVYSFSYTASNGTFVSASGSTVQSVCSAIWPQAQAANAAQGYVHTVINQTSSGLVCSATYLYEAGNQQDVGFTVTQSQGCPANATLGGGVCTCGAGFVPNSGATACQAEGCASNTVAASGYVKQTSATTMAPLQCLGGCEVVFDGYTGTGSTIENGVKTYYGSGTLIRTGDTCASGQVAASSGATVPAPTCAAGQVMGTINGAPVCVASGSTSSTATTGGGGTAGTSSTSTTANGDGTTTTTTTSTGTRNLPGGGTSTTTTTTQRTCDTAGNCDETSETEGTPEEEPLSECEKNPDVVGCAELGELAPETLTPKTVNLSIVKDTGWDHAMTCPASKVLNLHMVTLVVPFDLLCTAADMARPIVIAVAWLSAVFIFLGVSRRD